MMNISSALPKMSSLLRKGAALHPQGYGEYVNDDGHTCSLGAIITAITGELPDMEQDEVINCIQEATGICIAERSYDKELSKLYDGRPVRLHASIVHRNDTLKMSYEEIACWLEEEKGY